MKDKSKNGTILAMGGGALALFGAGLAAYAASIYGADPAGIALILVTAAAGAGMLTAGIWGFRAPEKRRALSIWVIVAGVLALAGTNLAAVLFGVAGGALMRTGPAAEAERPQMPPGIAP